jgi:hypothetical protein
MSHVVLLGDSIFDNRVYVAPEPDVRHQLQAQLGAAWGVTLLAFDGHVTADVKRQLQRMPEGATHLAIFPSAATTRSAMPPFLASVRLPSRKRSSGCAGAVQLRRRLCRDDRRGPEARHLHLGLHDL